MHLTSDNSQPPAWTFDSTGCPTPYHRWAANEDATGAIKAHSMKDRCLTCGVSRYSPLSGVIGVKSNSVAAGPCPEKPWRELLNTPALTPYVLNYVDDSGSVRLTPSERAALAEVPA
jgi:hypothetical protein